MDIHTIRLRGPWELEPLARSVRGGDCLVYESVENLPAPCRQHMPGDWGPSLGADFRGRVRYRRRFGRPTALEPHETVWLVLAAVDPAGDVSLGGQRLGRAGPAEPAEFEITALLQERNELIVEVDLPLLEPEAERALRPARCGQPGGLVGEVRLEIRAGS